MNWSCGRRERRGGQTCRRTIHRLLQRIGVEVDCGSDLDSFRDAARGQDDGILPELRSDRA
jgi:hypothetical protein